MKTVYLASPYSHDRKEIMNAREAHVTRVAAALMSKHRVSFFLPITQSAAMQRYNPTLGDGSFAFWADIDLHEVALRDETWVVQLEGWDKSIGVLAEIKHAKKLGKPVYYINPRTLKKRKAKNKVYDDKIKNSITITEYPPFGYVPPGIG